MPNTKEEIEQVFALTGGELEDETWVYHQEGKEGRIAFWYEGQPSYVAQKYYANYRNYRTAILCCLFSAAPHQIPGKPGEKPWMLQEIFASSGEARCSRGGVPVQDPVCELCGEKFGTSHGYIYLGDGWVEAVYKQESEE